MLLIVLQHVNTYCDKDVNICLLLQKREISLRSFCGGERTHCYWGRNRGSVHSYGQHNGLSLRPGKEMSVLPGAGYRRQRMWLRGGGHWRWPAKIWCELLSSEYVKMSRGHVFVTSLTLPACRKGQVPLQRQNEATNKYCTPHREQHKSCTLTMWGSLRK